jgi:hypothetical protein
LLIVNVAFYAVLLAFAMFYRPGLVAILKTLSPGGTGPQMQLEVGRLLPVYDAIAMVGTGLVAMGIWKLWNWSRVVALVLTGFSFVKFVVSEGATGLRPGGGGAMALTLGRPGLCAPVIWYLCSLEVRKALGRSVSYAS